MKQELSCHATPKLKTLEAKCIMKLYKENNKNGHRTHKKYVGFKLDIDGSVCLDA